MMAEKGWVSACICTVEDGSVVTVNVGVIISGVFVTAIEGVGVIVGEDNPLHAINRMIKTPNNQFFFMQHHLPKTKPGQA